MSLFSLLSMINGIAATIIIVKVAPSRGRRVWPYAVLAFFIGLLALIPLFARPNLNRRAQIA